MQIDYSEHGFLQEYEASNYAAAHVSPSSSERVARWASVTCRRAFPGLASFSPSFFSPVLSSFFLSAAGEEAGLRGEGVGLRRPGLLDRGILHNKNNTCKHSNSFTASCNHSRISIILQINLVNAQYLAIVGSSWKMVGPEVGGAGLPPFLGLSRSIAPLDMIFLIGESVLTAGPCRA